MKKALWIFGIVCAGLLLAFYLSLAPDGAAADGGSAPATRGGAARPDGPARVSLVWQIGPETSADVGRNRLLVTGRGTANPKEYHNPAQAQSIALRTARHLAYEKLAESVGGIRVVSATTYRDLVPQADALSTEVDALVRGAAIEREDVRTTARGYPAAEVTLALPLYGKDKGFFTRLAERLRSGTISLTLPRLFLADAGAAKPDRAPATPPAASRPRAAAASAAVRYSGVLLAMPARLENMAALPRIVDADGRTVLNFATDLPEPVLADGPVVTDSPTAPACRAAVGERPLTVRVAASPRRPGDLVIQTRLSDAERRLLVTAVSEGRFAFLVIPV